MISITIMTAVMPAAQAVRDSANGLPSSKTWLWLYEAVSEAVSKAVEGGAGADAGPAQAMCPAGLPEAGSAA